MNEVLAHAGDDEGGHHMMDGMMNEGIFGYTSGWGGMLIFWIAVVAVVVLLVRTLSGQSSMSASSDKALDVLRERYAKGEIDKKEFEEKKRDLS